MTRDEPAWQPGRAATWAYTLLALAGLTVVGRLAMGAWLERPTPAGLPRIGGSDGPPRALLVVIVDGLRAEALWEAPSALPFLRALADDGAGGVALAGNPTLTAACVRTLLTGRRPDLLAGLRNFNAPATEGSWVEYLRARGARAAHAGDAAIAQLCAPYLAPQDVLAFPDRGPTDQGECDALALPFVLERVERGYELVTLHLTAPDHAGHKHGALGEAYRAACAGADAALRRLVEAFRARHADATILVAADHGVSAHGTHGGGELSARRAPFVLVGPGVARGLGVELPQAALAPTLCALLGLPQPPLAEEPPATELLALPAAVVQRALDAHVQARAWVARAQGSPSVEPIERKRAEVAVSRLGAEGLERLQQLSRELESAARPVPLGAMLGTLGLALLGLAALLSSSSAHVAPSRAALLAAGALALFVLSLAPWPGSPTLPLLSAGTSLALTAALALWRCSPAARLAAGAGCALLLALPLLFAAGVVLRDTLEGASIAALEVALLVAGGLALAGTLAWSARQAWRQPSRRPASPAQPGLGVVVVGAALGVLLSLKPLLDPFVPVVWLVVAVTLAALLTACRRSAAVSARLVCGGAAVLLLAPRILGPTTGSWVQQLPIQTSPWLGAGLALSLAALGLVPRPWLARSARGPLGLGLLALGLAFAERLLRGTPGAEVLPGSVLLAFGPQLAALGTLAWATSPRVPQAARTAARLLAALALARRLTASDPEAAAFAALCCVALPAARLVVPTGRAALARLALLVLLVRTAAFHALGGVESFSTVDVGAGFLGLERLGFATEAVAQGGGVTLTVVLAGLQVALRFALPWLLLFTVLGHAAAPGPGSGPSLRSLLCDLALAFAARSAALLLCLWAFADNAWWVEQAYTVYALGAADLVLLLAAGAAAGAWRRAAPLHAGGPSPMMRACSA